MAHPHTDQVAARLAKTIWLDIDDVSERYGVTPGTIWRWCRESRVPFPSPARLTPRVTRWRLQDLEAFEAEMLRTSAA